MASKTIRFTFMSVLAAVAVAQDATECSIEGTKTISNQTEADSLAAACPTFTGSISIGNSVPYHDININGIKEITGSLTTKDWDKVTADSLERIGGSFENHDSFTVTMDFPKLAYVGGNGIRFTESNAMRPGLQNMLFPSLTTVDGDFIVTGNHYLSNWQTPALERVNGLFQIQGSFGIFTLTLDKLETVLPGGIDFAGSFWKGISLASIQSVQSKFSIVAYSSGNCTDFDALREPGKALAATEQYNCEGNCKNIYGNDCIGQRATTTTRSGTPPTSTATASSSSLSHPPGSDATWAAVSTHRPHHNDGDEEDGEAVWYRKLYLKIKLIAGICGSFTVLAIVGVVFWWRWRRRRAQRTRAAALAAAARDSESGEEGRRRVTTASADQSSSGSEDDKSEKSDPPPPYEAHAR